MGYDNNRYVVSKMTYLKKDVMGFTRMLRVVPERFMHFLLKGDFLASLVLRLYLASVFYAAAVAKWDPLSEDSFLDPISGLEGTSAWFGNSDWGLGLPFPFLLAFLAWASEYFGAVALVLGIWVRWACLPLLVTMTVAIGTVHWGNGWQAIHDLKSPFPSPLAGQAIERLERAKVILREHGNYQWLTEHGNFVISNSGIEWAFTYFAMLLALLFLGGGRFISLDYWLVSAVKKTG
jgi:putative oxidoreductase